jgi:hypothetical protein
MIGVTVHSLLLQLCTTDYREVVRHGSVPEEILVAKTNIRRQVLYTTTQLCVVLLGVSSMTAPQPPMTYSAATLFGSLFIIAWEVLLIVNAVMDHISREALLSMLRERNQAPRSKGVTRK